MISPKNAADAAFGGIGGKDPNPVLAPGPSKVTGPGVLETASEFGGNVLSALVNAGTKRIAREIDPGASGFGAGYDRRVTPGQTFEEQRGQARLFGLDVMDTTTQLMLAGAAIGLVLLLRGR
jgi:hypothetical protein